MIIGIQRHLYLKVGKFAPQLISQLLLGYKVIGEKTRGHKNIIRCHIVFFHYLQLFTFLFTSTPCKPFFCFFYSCIQGHRR
ncbi:unnamed protein product [Callosobruchus maculatus]|uniref:Uncharacterized protein n=1 Tax=Callosobruchus maculatus TaxID=64391 RepID=A0A653D412_CALMS|nr:unnamed protein product [Callosobruchus maculatus]